MLTVQHLFRPEGIVSDAKGQVQASAEFVRTYNAQAHENHGGGHSCTGWVKLAAR